jgi:hypothetical protein
MGIISTLLLESYEKTLRKLDLLGADGEIRSSVKTAAVGGDTVALIKERILQWEKTHHLGRVFVAANPGEPRKAGVTTEAILLVGNRTETAWFRPNKTSRCVSQTIESISKGRRKQQPDDR